MIRKTALYGAGLIVALLIGIGVATPATDETAAATAQPTATATPRPTVRPTPRPTPRPTARPTPEYSPDGALLTRLVMESVLAGTEDPDSLCLAFALFGTDTVLDQLETELSADSLAIWDRATGEEVLTEWTVRTCR